MSVNLFTGPLWHVPPDIPAQASFLLPGKLAGHHQPGHATPETKSFPLIKYSNPRKPILQGIDSAHLRARSCGSMKVRCDE